MKNNVLPRKVVSIQGQIQDSHFQFEPLGAYRALGNGGKDMYIFFHEGVGTETIEFLNTLSMWGGPTKQGFEGHPKACGWEFSETMGMVVIKTCMAFNKDELRAMVAMFRGLDHG